MKFSELGLDKELLKSIQDNGYETPTPIQEETIPDVLDGKDIIGQAQTGTGKTAAFGLPILQHIDINSDSVQGIIISPTRELAAQTQSELVKLGKYKRVRTQVVFGGASITQQINNLKRHPHIIVGTPGRLIDHINRKTIKLDQIKTLVLDEADNMLDMGFLPDIKLIISKTPSKRQTLLFSATMPKEIKNIGINFMVSPKHVMIKAKELTTELVDQYYIRCKEFEKFDLLTRLIDVQDPKLAVIFGRTKRRVDEVYKGLVAKGYSAQGIHGDLTQQSRASILKQFRNGELTILVATDVAARGLDISGVTHVYNYDITQDSESYVHRIGRTGRAGSKGTSVTLVTSGEMEYLRDIEKLSKKRLVNLKPPTSQQAFIGRVENAKYRIEKEIKNTDFDSLSDKVDLLLENHDAKTLIAAYIHKEANADIDNIKVNISSERPLPRKKSNDNGKRYKDSSKFSKKNNGYRKSYSKNNGNKTIRNSK